MINQTKANSQLTVRSLAEMFGCGRTQISDNKKLRHLYEVYTYKNVLHVSECIYIYNNSSLNNL